MMNISTTIRLLLLLLLVVVAFPASHSSSDDDDLKMLGDLEDLMHSVGNINPYLYHAGGKKRKSRNPESLLHQFNSAIQSPKAIRKLKRFRNKLRKQNTPLSSSLTGHDAQLLIDQIDSSLGKAASDINCDPTTRYRTLDGSCNNIGVPEQGSAETPLIRLVENNYDDGLSKPRSRSASGWGQLPNARHVSRSVFDGRTTSQQKRHFTSLGVHFGQITDHDLTAVESQEAECGNCEVHGECFAITLNRFDPVFGAGLFGAKKCFPFIRAHHEHDQRGVRQQINSITTWLDASFVYGSDDITADTLSDDSGFLKHLTDRKTGKDLLPPNKDLSACAGVNENANIFCGLAGDGRAAEQPGLTSLHTLFLREHNRIAKKLRLLNPSLDAVEVYKKARRIVGAEWQHILYNEFLPEITGTILYNSNGLSPNAPYHYNPHVDATIANVFAAAAFRFGHTEVPDVIIRASKEYRTNIPEIKMREAFFNASFLFDESIPDGAVDSILRGMMVQELDKVDQHLTSAITDNLFGDPDVKGDGFDIASLNIQRARDHGIPSYAVIRKEICGFDPINSYQDLQNIMSANNIRNLKQAYGWTGVRDIDAFVGLILEEHLPNTLVGPTLACIFADQFKRLKFGDRFFYKNPEQFTKAEMQEIEKVTMARLMCDNVEGVTRIQPYAFFADEDYSGKSRKGQYRSYDSFVKYAKSGDWPHERPSVLEGLDNRVKACRRTDLIPAVDLSVF